MDSATGNLVRHRAGNRCEYCRLPQEVFNPRDDSWDDHFALVGAEIVGLTPIGRATVRLLQMNSERRLILRKRLLAAGEL